MTHEQPVHSFGIHKAPLPCFLQVAGTPQRGTLLLDLLWEVALCNLLQPRLFRFKILLNHFFQ